MTIRGLPEPPVNRIAAENVGDGPAIGFAGVAVQNGIPLATVGRLPGHRLGEATLKYVHLSDDGGDDDRGTATLAAFAVEWIGSAPCRVRGDLSCDNGALEILGASG